ncbi:MAG: hypothetical protein ACPG4Z_04835 [Chitinophagales bacterium]
MKEMTDFSARIAKIQARAQKLFVKLDTLQNQNISLNNENQDLKKRLQTEKTAGNELQEQIKMLKLAKSIGGENISEEKTDLKRKINEYIKEIDKCIALLNE